MLSDEVVSAVARFFEAGRGPSHDELSRLFRRFGVEGADPLKRFPGEQIGSAMLSTLRDMTSTQRVISGLSFSTTSPGSPQPRRSRPMFAVLMRDPTTLL